jgi:hypothetical protein
MTKVDLDGQPGSAFDAAIIEDSRWNGWARPWFTTEVGIAIAKMTYEWARAEGMDNVHMVLYDEENRRFLYQYEHTVDPVARRWDVASQCWLHAIGNCDWVWSEVRS